MQKFDSAVKNLLKMKTYAYVATINPDGSPQVTPTWVDADEDYVLINTALGRAKVRNVKRDPRVALSVVDPQNPERRMVQIRGRVVEQIAGKAADDHLDDLTKRYVGVDKYPWRQPGMQRVILKIRPEHISGNPY